MFLVIKRQDSTCFYSNLPLIFFSIAHDMKVCGMLCSVLVTRIKSNDKWSNRENFSRLIQKYRREGNRKKKTRSCWRLTRLHFELSSLILSSLVAWRCNVWYYQVTTQLVSWSNGHVTLRVRACHGRSAPLLVLC